MDISETVVWGIRGQSSPGVIDGLVDEFEFQCARKLHPVAKEHLRSGSGHVSDPFPRLEEHDGYLFGLLSIPSSVTDENADFDEVVFAMTHNYVVAVVTTHENTEIKWETIPRILAANSQSFDQGSFAGRFLVSLFQFSVSKIFDDARYLMQLLIGISHKLLIRTQDQREDEMSVTTIASMTRKQRQVFMREVDGVREVLFGVRKELPGIKRIIQRTGSILNSIASDEIDLNVAIDDVETEMFPRHLEIHLFDLCVEIKHIESWIEEIDELIELANDQIKQADAFAQIRANQFTGAIASIMLVPTFIVGLYGQNLNFPEKDTYYGYMISWLLILSATVGQVLFFRRRRWI
jgi:magnesium transporter